MARTKSVKRHEDVLEAALALFVDRGIDATSMDAIAEASGVSKATIYKHWADKDALALEALSRVFGLDTPAPTFDSGDLQDDFVDALVYQPANVRPDLKARIMPHVMAYAARHREFGTQWRSQMIERPRARLTALLQRGLAQGVFVRGLDVESSLALLVGPMMYWQIFINQKNGGAIPRSLAEHVVQAFWKAHRLATSAWRPPLARRRPSRRRLRARS